MLSRSIQKSLERIQILTETKGNVIWHSLVIAAEYLKVTFYVY